jgi:hypothetical protein
MPVRLPVTIVVHPLLPGSQQAPGTPVPIRQCGPRPPHSRRCEPKGSQSGDDSIRHGSGAADC